MRTTTRTCLAVCTCCVIALAVQDESKEQQHPLDEFDFDFEGFNDDEPELTNLEAEEILAPYGSLEPEAEMLPANYEGVRPPGVDHMEMRAKERKLEVSEDRNAARRRRRRFSAEE